MTGGIGFVSTGKDTYRKNRGFLKHTDKVKSRKTGPHHGTDLKLKFKNPTKEELDDFKIKFHAKRKRENKKLVVLTIIISSITIGILYLILF